MSTKPSDHEECWSCVGLARGMCPREAFESILGEDLPCFTASEFPNTTSQMSSTTSPMTSTTSSTSVSNLYLATEGMKKLVVSNLGKQIEPQSREV